MAQRRTLILLMAGLLLGTGCSSGTSEPAEETTISRETFVETYFALRVAALRRSSQEITPAVRDQVLREQGVTQEDLLHFVEVRGDEPGFMEGIWNEIENRMRLNRSDPRTDPTGPAGRRNLQNPEGGPARGLPGESPDRGGPGGEGRPG